MSQPRNISVLGGGAWGTALAANCRRAGQNVRLFARNADTVAALNATRQNPNYLGNVLLPEGIKASTDAEMVLDQADIVLAVVPAQLMGKALAQLEKHIPIGAPVVLCAKGIEQSSGRLMSEVAKAVLPDHTIAVLSGPSFAADVARGLPTAVTVACSTDSLAASLARTLSGNAFRCYSSLDVTGVELGGAIKNVLALAAGASTGRGFGASAQAALITRGFAELRRLGKAIGARPETIMGLSGLGDLMLTCSSPQSRNYSYGLAVGRGEDLSGRPLAEGVATAPIAAQLCQKFSVKAPIIEATAALLNKTISIDEAVEALLRRPLKSED